MASPVAIYAGAASMVRTGGATVVAIYGQVLGGYIENPSSPADQNVFFLQPVVIVGPDYELGPFNTAGFNSNTFNGHRKAHNQRITYVKTPTIEPLFVDLTGPAALEETATTIILWPGQGFQIPVGQATNVYVNAATSGHKFSCVIFQPPTQYPPTPIPSTFPPNKPTGKTTTIKSYLYQEYSDDDDLQAFVDSYNTMTQDYVDTFNDLNLPIYTQPLIAGTLLDWVAQGIYGLARPSLFTGNSKTIGPLNTWPFNTIIFNVRKKIGTYETVETTDDIFKRIITWHFYKGDGKVFNIRWLKRRVLRFIDGSAGTDPDTAATYGISVSFAGNRVVDIRMPTSPIAQTFQEAVQSGALELPFQYAFRVTTF